MIAFFGKILIFFGFFLILVGIFFLLGEKILSFGKLPGDILIKKGNFTFYFPLGTCILVSIVLSIIFYLIFRFFK